MSWFSRLFGSKTETGPAGTDTAGKPEDHKGFTIIPAPIPEGGQYRVAARIEKDGQSHQLVRADTMASLDEARSISVAKARQMIDEQGERIFAPR